MGSKTNSKTSKGGKQNGSKAGGGKLQAQNNRIGKDQNGESHTDFSMLRKPIDISVTGVGQVVKVYQTGTSEVRQLLAYECDLVYECKICRNLFRSLANFLSHKRVYCKELFGDSKHVFPADQLVEDCTVIIQPEPVPPTTCTETWITNDAMPVITRTATGSSDDSEGPSSPHVETSIPRITANKNAKRDLSQIVEQLSQKRGLSTVTETVGHLSASKFYESVSEQVTAKRDARTEHLIRLETIENTKFGVFQTVLHSTSSNSQMENMDLMKAQVVELHNMMSSNEATLGPDGHISTINGISMPAHTPRNEGKSLVPLAKKQDNTQNIKESSSKESHVCPICNTRFSTRKTLNHHMKSLHVTFRVCYPCPCCKNTFCNKWSVYRHLYKVHRKTTLQVRKLRSQIVNKAFKKEMATQENKNSNAKSTSISAQSEADKARKEQQRLHQENQAWMNNFEDDLELQMCGGCGRRFERRAALNSHSQICQKRIAIQNNIKARRPSPSVPTPSSTSNRVTNTKVSTERQNSTRADTSSSESNANRLTPLSVISDSGVKCMMTPSPSPVPLDITTQLHASSPNASYNRTRHCSGSRADNTKKDIPEKRIEIQIRRDYCKTGSAVNSVAGVTCQQDLISEENENSPSSDIEENAEGDNVDRESGAEFATKDTDTKLKENVGADDCNSSVASESDKMESEGVSDEDCALSLKLEDSDDDNVPSVPDVVEGCDTYVDFVKEKSEDREADTEWNSVKTDMLHNSRELQNDVVEAGEMLDKISTSTVAKKEEQFSPVMENRMQSMINIRRLQCLSCQKKFNKLTNLKRHVAVHIGWNRYRCIQCTFKCYSKYDCVAHVNKVHLGNADKEKAQTMVQSIETQGSDGEYNSSKCDITEESYKVKNEESGIDINLTDKYETTAADIEITLNNPCTEVSDWTLLDCNDSKTSSPEYNITIEAIPTNTEESPLKEEATEECLLTSEEQGYKDMEIDPLMSIKEHGSITGTLRTYKVKGGKGSSVNRQTTTDPQEPNKSTIPTLRLRPKRRRASNEELETVTSKKALRAVEYEKNVGDVAVLDVQENEAHKPKTETYVHNDSDSTSADAGSQVEDPSDKQDAKEQTALRKMVLEVIFGSSNNNMNQDLEATHNMFSVAVNGEHYPLAGSESSPEPYDVIETVSSDSTSPLTTNSSAASPLLTSDDGSSVVTEQAVKDDGRCSRQTKCGNSVTPVYETERRQRPVRNRVKVEKEDFIYDLSDRCLDPRRDREERSSHSSKASRRKLQEERTRDSMKMAVEKGNYSGENSAPKLLPKLMLVRTNLGEYTGVKVVKPGNSTVTQAFDNSSGTNSSSNAVGYNISTRKSQRTFDISPHKIPPSNKDRINEDE